MEPVVSSGTCDIIFGKTKLVVERRLCPDITKIVSNPRKKDEEIEVRFGYTIDGRHKSGLSNDAKEARQKWYQLYKLLQESDLYRDPVREKSIVEVYGSLRKITDIGVPGKPIFQDKKKLNSIDLLNFQVGELSYYCRLMSATEVLRPGALTSGKPDFRRVRNRVSFVAKDGSHRFDLTYVGDGVYEAEIEYLAVVDLDGFFRPIKLVVHVLKGASELVTTSEFTGVIRMFNDFFAKEAKFDATKFYRRGLPQPVNLKRATAMKMSAYAATNKLNGTRMVGIFVNNELYLINMVGQVLKVLSGLSASLNRTVVDLEYFKGVAYCFDILFASGADVRTLNLDERLKHLSKIVSVVDNPVFQAKKFFMSGDISQDTLDVLAMVDGLPADDNDGIIYTPITEPYFNGHIYKWKPPEMLTIDFTASVISTEERKYVLQVKNKFDKLVTFSQPGFSGVIVSAQQLKGVGEYRWTGDTFELVRPRPDKDAPNFIDIAKDVWEDIRNPLTRQILTDIIGSEASEDRDSLRKFNNSVKRDLIQKYLSGRVVLDLGAGKGGDLGKYSFSKIRKLYAVEPNKTNLDELESRADALKKKNQLNFTLVPIHAKAQQTQMIVSDMKTEKVDGAAMFFSLSFFFENKLVLDELIRTLAATIDKDGLFVGTTIDGEATRQLLAGGNAQLGNVGIKKMYSDFSGPIAFNKMVSFIYSGSQTVAEEQIEFLVDWEMFIKRMLEVGFTLVESNIFDPQVWMTPEEQTVAKLYRSFVFRRLSLDTIERDTKERDTKERDTKERDTMEEKKPSSPPKKHLGAVTTGTNMRLKGTLLAAELKKEGHEYELVRTGTHGDGDCFFHAVLTAIDPAYRAKKSADQKKQAQEFRKSIVITKERWMSLAKGSLARVGPDVRYPGFDTLFYQNMLENKGYADKKINILLSFDKDPKRLKYWIESLGRNRTIQNLDLPEYIVKIRELFAQQIGKYDTASKALKEFDTIVEDTKEQAYKVFSSLVGSCGTWVGQEVLEVVSDKIDRDIFIMEDTEGDAYRTECDHVKDRRAIILLILGGSHYETVGQIMPQNIVRREWESNDSLISLIKKRIC